MAKTTAVHEVKCALPKQELFLLSLNGREQLGRPFEYVVELVCDKDDIDYDKLLGSSLTILLRHGENLTRHFNGHVCELSHEGIHGGYFKYRAVLRPWLWMLTRTTDCRIFQDKTVVEIFEDVCKTTHGFSDFKKQLTATYPKREYTVQYRETDYDFLNRLLETEGIYYYFEHSDGKHELVLSDSYSAHKPIAGEKKVVYRPPGEASVDQEHIQNWRVHYEIQPGNYVLDDYDFEKPKASLESKSQVKRKHSQATFEQFDYPGVYRETSVGNSYAKIRLQSLQSQHKMIDAIGDARGLATGGLFDFAEFPRKDQNAEYLIVDTEYDIRSGEVEQFSEDANNYFAAKIKVIGSKEPFRTPLVTPKPLIAGPQTAVVVGKKGEEIWTDKYGRVKVQFRWDRLGKSDENSSCWVRVSHMFAGKKWGAVNIPRMGQEVLIEFEEGDPDRPVITGRLYNADLMPPYDLPANQTQTGMKTRSTKKGNEKTFNELRFEDKKEEEEIYFHAEKDFNRVVENDDTLKVGFEKKDKGDQSIEVFNNQKVAIGTDECADGSQTVDIFKDQTLTIGNDQTETIKDGNRKVTLDKGDDTLTITQGKRTATVQGNETLTVKQGNMSVDIKMGKATIKAMQSIELKVGASSIKIEPAKITISSVQISVAGQAKSEVKATMVDVNGSAMTQIKGGLVKIN